MEVMQLKNYKEVQARRQNVVFTVTRGLAVARVAQVFVSQPFDDLPTGVKSVSYGMMSRLNVVGCVVEDGRTGGIENMKRVLCALDTGAEGGG